MTSSVLSGAGLADIMEEYRGKSASEIVAELNKVPFFMTGMTEESENAPEIEALKALAYDGEPHEIALNFKNQGNEAFREGRFQDAIVFYTNALNQNSGEEATDIACLGNRAQCNLELRNYRRTIDDSARVLRTRPDNLKALYRTAKAFFLLRRYEEAAVFADEALKHDPKGQALAEIKSDSIKHLQMAREVEERRQLQAEAELARAKALDLALTSRQVTRVYTPGVEREVKPHGASIYLEDELDPTSVLMLPALLLYPQEMSSDFVQAVAETDTITDLLDTVLGDGKNSRYSELWATEALHLYAPTRSGGLAKIAVSSSIGRAIGSRAPDIVLVDNQFRLYVVAQDHAREWLSSWNKKAQAQQYQECVL